MPPPYLQLFCAFQLRCEAVRSHIRLQDPGRAGTARKDGRPEARREYVAIVTTELRDALERHGGDTSLLADAP